MKESWSKFKEWWSNLASREKQAILLGASLFSIFIVYEFMWTPALVRVASLRNYIEKEQKTLVWMQAADGEIKKIALQTKHNNKLITPVVLLGLLQKQIGQAGLEQYLTQLKQASNETIAMNFQKVDFDKLVRLLTVILKEGNVTITHLSAIADNTPGIVNADVILKLA